MNVYWVCVVLPVEGSLSPLVPSLIHSAPLGEQLSVSLSSAAVCPLWATVETWSALGSTRDVAMM